MTLLPNIENLYTRIVIQSTNRCENEVNKY